MTGTMRAAVLHGREDVRIERVPIPSVGEGELLLRNRVALTCGTDVKVFRRGYHARMITPPAGFGHEVSGVVEEVGRGVVGLRPGASVVVVNSAPCGACEYCRSGRTNLCDDLAFWNGAYAEYSLLPARFVSGSLIAHTPGMTHRQAAIVEPLACAVRGIAESGVGPGQSVAVIGVGPLGLMLVALAKMRGAHVVAIGRNPDRLARARAFGADEAISALDEPDMMRALRRRSPGERGPDVVIEAAGTLETADAALAAVRKGGLVNLFAGCPAGARLSVNAERLHYDELTVKSSFHHTPESVKAAFEIIASGRLDVGAFVTADATLDELPAVLRGLTDGANGLKTAILPWGGEGSG